MYRINAVQPYLLLDDSKIVEEIEPSEFFWNGTLLQKISFVIDNQE